MLRFALLALICLSLASCDAVSIGEAQQAFELAALANPSGYTSTDAQGRVISEDAQDWTISPFHQSSFTLTLVPYPNPASPTQSVRIAGVYSAGGSGLVPYRIDSKGDLVRIEPVTGSQDGSAPTFTFTAGQLQSIGLERVVLTDFEGRIVTYGDIQVIP